MATSQVETVSTGADKAKLGVAIALVIAALAGFAASRFLTASADRGGQTAGRSEGISRAGSSTATTSTSPVSPATGTGYATGYNSEGSYNG